MQLTMKEPFFDQKFKKKLRTIYKMNIILCFERLFLSVSIFKRQFSHVFKTTSFLYCEVFPQPFFYLKEI